MMKASPLVPWIGGKRRLAKHLLPMFPEHSCYVEPFCGAAALFFMKDQVESEVLNDINGDLVSLYRVVKNHLEEFIRQFKYSLSSRQMYDWLNSSQVEPLTDIQRAARCALLLSAEAWIRREGQQPYLRRRHHQSAED